MNESVVLLSLNSVETVLCVCFSSLRPSEVESVDGNVGDGFAQPSRPEEGPLQTTSISPLLPFSLVFDFLHISSFVLYLY